jgi:hypothetical protein
VGRRRCDRRVGRGRFGFPPASEATAASDVRRRGPQAETLVEPGAVVPTGRALDALVARSRFLVVGARNEPRAAALLEAAGARRLLPRVSVSLVPSARVKPLLARMNTPGRRLARFVETPADRTDVIEPLPPRNEYAFTDPLASPTYAWHVYAVGANQVPASGPGFPITVFDSGLDATHPDFAGRANTVLLNPQSVSLNGEDYHGTMVASTAAAALNGQDAEGIYADAALRSYDFDYSTAESYYGGFAAASRAGPSVVNMSFGGAQASRADYEAIVSTFADGSLPVAAAGNEYQEGNTTSYPAAYPHVLTVAATDQTGAPASFSSSGPHVDLAAPGVAIPVQDARDPRAYYPVDGTSFAAPIVSAAAAWVMTRRPWRRRSSSSSSGGPRATPPSRAGTSARASASSTFPRCSARRCRRSTRWSRTTTSTRSRRGACSRAPGPPSTAPASTRGSRPGSTERRIRGTCIASPSHGTAA